MTPSLRYRALSRFLQQQGIVEPEAEHIALLEKIVFSQKPSGRVCLPGGVVVGRNYNSLMLCEDASGLSEHILPCPGSVLLPVLGLRVVCRPAAVLSDKLDSFTVTTEGPVLVRCRKAGDAIRLQGGTKSLKKLFIDSKIPVYKRANVPVIADNRGIVGILGFGADRNHLATKLPAVEICFEQIEM